MFRRLRIGIATALAVAFAITSGVSAQTSNVITIGYTGPLSGGAAQYGADVQRGIQMAIDEINAAGGVMIGGKKSTFKLSSLDDQYRPPAAQTNAQRLAQEGATVIFCPHAGVDGSGQSRAVYVIEAVAQELYNLYNIKIRDRRQGERRATAAAAAR